MTGDEYESWIESALTAYAEERAGASGGSVEATLTRERARLPSLLPQGHETPGMWLLVVLDESSADVGRMWLGSDREQPGTVFVWVIEIGPQSRGQGLGRAAMIAAEGFAKERSALGMSLNVFGPNAIARRLYESLGYDVTSVQMAKQL
jgi:GNAT superfamily N-acetyltransferase